MTHLIDSNYVCRAIQSLATLMLENSSWRGNTVTGSSMGLLRPPDKKVGATSGPPRIYSPPPTFSSLACNLSYILPPCTLVFPVSRPCPRPLVPYTAVPDRY
jgi:hypothetical protein